MDAFRNRSQGSLNSLGVHTYMHTYINTYLPLMCLDCTFFHRDYGHRGYGLWHKSHVGFFSGEVHLRDIRVHVSFERGERCLPRIRSDRVISLGFRGWTNKKGERDEINRGDSLSQIRPRGFSLAAERLRKKKVFFSP